MRRWQMIGILALSAGCGGGGEPETPPRGVDVLGNRIRTPNVAAAVCGWLLDSDQDGEVDGTLGRVTVVGTTWDDPCSIVESGNPPEGESLDMFRVEAQWSDLAQDTLWEYGVPYVADGTTQNQITVRAWRNDAGVPSIEAGGPPMGTLTLVSDTLEGLHFTLDGGFAYANYPGGERDSASPPAPFSIDWTEVPTCPAACDNI